MRLALDQLPNDVTRLKQLIVSQQQERAAEVEQLRAEHEAALQAAVEQAVEPLQAAVEQANQEVENAKQEVEQAQQELERLQLAMALLLQRQYGPRSEKFDPRQLLLFGEIVDSQPLDEADLAEETGESSSPAVCSAARIRAARPFQNIWSGSRLSMI